jgi:hypothetical protein
MLHHHGEVLNIPFDSGPTVNLQSLHRGLSSIYWTCVNELLVEILQALLRQGLQEDGTLWLSELTYKGSPRKRGILNGRERKTVAT